MHELMLTKLIVKCYKIDNSLDNANEIDNADSLYIPFVFSTENASKQRGSISMVLLGL